MKKFLNFKKLTIASVVLVVLANYSCKNDDIVSNQKTLISKEIKVENGRLKFVDAEHFRETLKKLESDESKETLDKWEHNFPNFISSRTAYYSITRKDIEKIVNTNSMKEYEDFATLLPDYDGKNKRLVRQIPGEAMSTLFNKEGIVIIGNDAYKLNLTKSVKFTNFKESDIVNYKNGIISKNVSSSPMKKVSINSKKLKTSISNAEHCTTYIDNDERFAADYNLY